MKQNKATKRALLMSVLSLVLCCSMLVGTTFAWFTDSVTSGKNKIVAGNLDVELYHTGAHGDEEKVSKTEDALFTDVDGNPILWEPGAAAFETFRVANEGTLALKFELALATDAANTVMDAAGNDTGKTIADVLKIAVVEDSSKYETREAMVEAVKDKMVTLKEYVSGNTVHSGKLLPEGATAPDPADGWKTESESFTVILYWEPSENDDLYNLKNGAYASDAGDDKPGELKIDLTVTLLAAQVPFESDSFDDQYDNKPFLPAEKLAARIAEDKEMAEKGYYFRIGDGDDVTYVNSVETDSTTSYPHQADILKYISNKGVPLVLTGDYFYEHDGYRTSKGFRGTAVDDGDYKIDLNEHNLKASYLYMNRPSSGDGYSFEMGNGKFTGRLANCCNIDLLGASKVNLFDLVLDTLTSNGATDKGRYMGPSTNVFGEGPEGSNSNGPVGPIKLFMNDSVNNEVVMTNVTTSGGVSLIDCKNRGTVAITDCNLAGSSTKRSVNGSIKADEEALYIVNALSVTMDNTTVDKKLLRFNNAGTVTITGCDLKSGLRVEGNTTVTLINCNLTNAGHTDAGYKYPPISVTSGRVNIVSGTYSFNPSDTTTYKNVHLASGSTVTQQGGVWVVTAGN